MNYATLLQRLKGVDGKVYSIGKSLCGRELFCIERGQGAPVLVHGAIHAREHLTADVVMDLTARTVPKGIKIYFVPMVNPDGVSVVFDGILGVSDKYRKLIKATTPDTKLFKANARCVDLNVNFDADWGTGLSNVYKPSFENYIGKEPFSEPETQALRDLTLQIAPRVTISYHLMGGEIYWSYGRIRRYKSQAERFATATGYPLKTAEGSAGGYKDWYLSNFDGIGLTVEVGRDLYHPYPDSELTEIIERNQKMLDVTATVMTELNWI